LFVPKGDLWGARGDQRKKNIPYDVNMNKLRLVLKIELHTNG